MAGLSTSARNLDEVRAALRAWFAHRLSDESVYVSPFETNHSSGFSNETLFFTLDRSDLAKTACVLRMPPAGDGLFPSYDLEMQWRLQTALAKRGLPIPAPVLFERDAKWLGTQFLVMPWIPGASPNDVTYMVNGWMKDHSPRIQRTCMESFADVLIALHSLDTSPYQSLLARPTGIGLEAELEWWHQYLLWASDGEPPKEMDLAYSWARQTNPGNRYRDSILWNDARLSNVVFLKDGHVGAALDWEQAGIGPAEMDVGFWFATRRQTCEAMGITDDPELPGFPSRAEIIARLEQGLGRSLYELEWHELFAMIRMGTCIVGTQRVLCRGGQPDHFIMQASLLPKWAIREMGLD